MTLKPVVYNENSWIDRNTKPIECNMEIMDTMVTLKDGTGVSLSPVSPGDRHFILDGFEQLSDRSRYSRYHTSMRTLPDNYLDALTNADDFTNVVVAAHLLIDGECRGIGLARYVRLEDESGVAEFSITVIDAYQNLGLGTGMLEYLIGHARQDRVSMLRGYVMPSNELMVGLLRRYERSGLCTSDGDLCYELDLTAGMQPPATMG